MEELAEFLGQWAVTGLPMIMKLVTPAFAAIMTFFHVQIFTALLVILMVDIVTGMWKAKVLNKLASQFFGRAFNRMAYYVIVYMVLHILTLSLPLGALSAIPESLIMTGYLLKEALSILENIKAIQTAKGYETPLIDKLITRLGMDFDKIAREIETSGIIKTNFAKDAVAPVNDESPAKPPETPQGG